MLATRALSVLLLAAPRVSALIITRPPAARAPGSRTAAVQSSGAAGSCTAAMQMLAAPLGFHPLASPAEYTELVENLGRESITVVKWEADYCRTCRAAGAASDLPPPRRGGVRYLR